MNPIEAMKKALTALEMCAEGHLSVIHCKQAYDVLRQAIEQMEKSEEVAVVDDDFHDRVSWRPKSDSVRDGEKTLPNGTPLYTHPEPLRELTDEEIDAVTDRYFGSLRWLPKHEICRIQLFSRAILAKARGE